MKANENDYFINSIPTENMAVFECKGFTIYTNMASRNNFH